MLLTFHRWDTKGPAITCVALWIFDVKTAVQLSIRLYLPYNKEDARSVLHFFRNCLLTLLPSTWITARYLAVQYISRAIGAPCLLYILVTLQKWSRLPASKVVFSATVSGKIIARVRSYWPSLIFPTQNEVFTSPPAHQRYFISFFFSFY